LKSLGVGLIVKNESKVILRALSSVSGMIDKIFICDTGSADNTIELVRNFSEENKIECEIIYEKWKNFSYNRNKLLELAKNKTDYLLLLDADMVVLSQIDKNKLAADGYYVHYDGSLDFAQILLVNNRIDWRYQGVTHEFIKSNEAKTYETLYDTKIRHLHDGTNRADKFNRDRELLLQGIIDEPKNSRYHFYLGQSFKDLGEYEKAMDYYGQAIKLSSWVEEIFYSKYQIGNCLENLKCIDSAKLSYLEAWEFRPNRAEPLYRLARICRNQKEYQQAYLYAKKGLEIKYPKDLLFIEKSVYDYLLLFEKSISAYYIGRFEESYNSCKKLTEIKTSEEVRIQNIKNLQFSKTKLLGKVVTPDFNRENALENLRDIYSICEKLKINIFPFAGTLLGIIREGNFIAHDSDLDFGIKLENFSPKLIEELITCGFKFERSFGKLAKGYEVRFTKRNIQIDFFGFYHKKDYDCTYCYDNSGSIYEIKFNKFYLVDYNFKEIKIKVPNDVNNFLAQQYGEDWKVPKKNWDYLKDPKNITKEKI